jgi:dienelactone hydrolase
VTPFSERPVSFVVGAVTLAGLLHAPAADGPLQGTGIVLVPGGLVRRTGLHRLYLTAARALTSRGAWVLRFDLPGVGESGGAVRAVTSTRLASLAGSHVEEARAALDLVERETGAGTLVVLGHCSGGRSALACADADARVDGVVAWATPVGDDRAAAPAGWTEEAVRRLHVRGTPALWVYGTRDVAWPAFQSMTAALAGTSSSGPPWTVHTIPSANHDFTSIEWTAAAIDATLDWMTARRLSRSRESGVRWTSA